MEKMAYQGVCTSNMIYTKEDCYIFLLYGENFRNKRFDLFRNDKDVVLRAAKYESYYFDYASDDLKRDKEFVIEVVKQDAWCFLYACEDLRNDKDVLYAIDEFLINYKGSDEWLIDARNKLEMYKREDALKVRLANSNKQEIIKKTSKVKI